MHSHFLISVCIITTNIITTRWWWWWWWWWCRCPCPCRSLPIRTVISVTISISATIVIISIVPISPISISIASIIVASISVVPISISIVVVTYSPSIRSISISSFASNIILFSGHNLFQGCRSWSISPDSIPKVSIAFLIILRSCLYMLPRNSNNKNQHKAYYFHFVNLS